MKSITKEIDEVCTAQPKYSPGDYQFMIDIAVLVLAARRVISNTYAIRFYLKGEQRQAFFDFMQGDLERSLEKLSGITEKNWIDNLDIDYQNQFHQGEKFFKFKEVVNTMKDVLENHFNTVCTSIQNGLPEVANSTEDDVDYKFDGTNGGKWACVTC